MRILIVGAGAIGGYFGGRLLEAGRDVTFLVRPGRAAQLASDGLVLLSPRGDASLPRPATVLAQDLDEVFDLVLLSCKAYDLAGAMDAFAPAVGPATVVLPLLNGMAHMDALDARFGAEKVLGGLCVISSSLDAQGRIVHANTLHGITFGERDGAASPRSLAIEAALSGAGFDLRRSAGILQEMWEKWVFIASVAGLTCLMRASIGDIVAAGATELNLRMVDECCAIAAANGFPPRPPSVERIRSGVTAAGSPMAASMLKDLERGAAVEADHVLGDLLARSGERAQALSLLRVAYLHLKAYEARRAAAAK